MAGETQQIEQTVKDAEEGLNLHIAFIPEQVGDFFGIPLTNTLITSWIVIIALVVFAIIVRSRISAHPKGVQNFVETLFAYILDYMTETLGNRMIAVAAFPLIVTIFLFIWISNWAEFLPGIGSILIGEHPLFRSVSTDLNVTIALALVSVVVMEVAGMRALGPLKYLGKFFNFASPLKFFIGLIELISELARLVSFSFRLFGNIFAGEVLILVMIALLPVVLPVPFMLFELFVGFIQAAIFALLTMFFIKIAITPSHE